MPVKKEVPSTRGSSRGEVPRREQSPKSGWAQIAEKKEQMDAEKEDRANKPRDFWLKSGETANVQFLQDEPLIVEGHSIKDNKGNWRFAPCQLSVQRHCLMCADGIYKITKAAFKLLDYRGNWDKDKKKFKNDEPLERYAVLSIGDAEKVKVIMDKKKTNLTDLVLEVNKTGSGKKTANNFSLAFDDDDKRIYPIEFKSEYPPIEEIMAPMSNAQLEATGFSAPERD